MDFLAGAAASVPVVFKANGDLRPPDANSATYALYGHTGAQLTSGNLTTTPTTTRMVITVSETHNAITRRFEKRTLVVRWTVDGFPFVEQISYRLLPFLNHTVTPQKIRSYLGVEPNELPDADVDLSAAYFSLEAEFGQEALETALSAGSQVEIAMNDALLYTAALAKIPGLQMRVAQSNTDGRIGFTRPVVKDWSEIQRRTLELREAALDVAFARTPTTWNLMQVSQDTDAITGA